MKFGENRKFRGVCPFTPVGTQDVKGSKRDLDIFFDFWLNFFQFRFGVKLVFMTKKNGKK